MAAAVNLSGKKTRAGRISGECCSATTKEENRNGKLSGSRTEISLNRGISVLFLWNLIKEEEVEWES